MTPFSLTLILMREGRGAGAFPGNHIGRGGVKTGQTSATCFGMWEIIQAGREEKRGDFSVSHVFSRVGSLINWQS